MLSRLRSYLLTNADQTQENSISSEQRKKRFGFFLEYCKELNKPLKIIDLGGSDYYWKQLNMTDNRDFEILILNNENQNTDSFSNIKFMKKDVRNLDFIKDKEYDLVYSNSLIEHLNSFEDQKKLANEIKRIGKRYFIQTPNYYFPVEPHFLFPFFQFLSVEMKTKLISKYDMGWYKKQTDFVKAKELAQSIRLLKENELKDIFGGCKIYKEKYYFLTKSFIVYS